MRNPNFACTLMRMQNSGPPLHKILDPPLGMYVLDTIRVWSGRGKLSVYGSTLC